jgi:hypothetical protein
VLSHNQAVMYVGVSACVCLSGFLDFHLLKELTDFRETLL